jgi:hypothetical protein
MVRRFAAILVILIRLLFHHLLSFRAVRISVNADHFNLLYSNMIHGLSELQDLLLLGVD